MAMRLTVEEISVVCIVPYSKDETKVVTHESLVVFRFHVNSTIVASQHFFFSSVWSTFVEITSGIETLQEVVCPL